MCLLHRSAVKYMDYFQEHVVPAMTQMEREQIALNKEKRL